MLPEPCTAVTTCVPFCVMALTGSWCWPTIVTVCMGPDCDVWRIRAVPPIDEAVMAGTGSTFTETNVTNGIKEEREGIMYIQPFWTIQPSGYTLYTNTVHKSTYWFEQNSKLPQRKMVQQAASNKNDEVVTYSHSVSYTAFHQIKLFGLEILIWLKMDLNSQLFILIIHYSVKNTTILHSYWYWSLLKLRRGWHRLGVNNTGESESESGQTQTRTSSRLRNVAIDNGRYQEIRPRANRNQVFHRAV